MTLDSNAFKTDKQKIKKYVNTYLKNNKVTGVNKIKIEKLSVIADNVTEVKKMIKFVTKKVSPGGGKSRRP
tara:strand:- start:1 stop:213 length:213 start_codon:yes stop_codon:yes gene_type:complete